MKAAKRIAIGGLVAVGLGASLLAGAQMVQGGEWFGGREGAGTPMAIVADGGEAARSSRRYGPDSRIVPGEYSADYAARPASFELDRVRAGIVAVSHRTPSAFGYVALPIKFLKAML